MAYKALTQVEMTAAMDALRKLVGEDKHVLLVLFDGAGNLEGGMLQFQYIATTQHDETPAVVRDLADAMAQRPAAPNVNPN